MDDGRTGLRTRLKQLVERRANRQLFDPRSHMVVPRSIYVPVTELDEIPEAVWDATTPMSGIDFDLDAQLAWGQRELAPFAGELGPADEPPQPGRFRYANQNYEVGDADIYYAMVRHAKPRHIIEIGSGWSTLAGAEAVLRNRAEGHECRYDAHDPFPQRDIILPEQPGVDSQQRHFAQDLSAETVSVLEANDILFVDSTHCVQLGGDVNHIILELLPAIAPGVLVQFHDIWLPYEYHRMLFEHLGMRWNEQYMLQAFLTGNDDWEILFATQALTRHDPDGFRAVVPGYDGSTYPSSFWMRRRD